MDPVHRVVAVAGLGGGDELTPEPGAGGLWRLLLGDGDGGVGYEALHDTPPGQQVIEAAILRHIVIAEVQELDPGVGERQVVLGPVTLDEVVLRDPVDLAFEREGVLLQAGEQVLPHLDGSLHRGGKAGAPGVPDDPVQVFPLDVKGGQHPAVGQANRLPAGRILADLPDGPDGVGQGQVPEHHIRFDHLQQRDGGAHLDVGGVFVHVGIAGDHMKPPEALGVGVRLIPRVDDGPRSRGGRGHPFPDVIGALRDREGGPLGGLEELARPREDLAADQERYEDVQHLLEVSLAEYQVVLMAPVGVAGRVGVVLVEEDVPPDAVVPEPLFGGTL